jgi:hypothetical protein
MKKSTANSILVIPDTIQLKIFCSLFSEQNNLKSKAQEAIILPLILYGCETEALNPRVSTSGRVFEKSKRKHVWNRSKVLREPTDRKKKKPNKGRS